MRCAWSTYDPTYAIMTRKKIIFWLLFALCLFLLFSSLILYYPLGYYTNSLVYSGFLLFNFFGLPEDYRQYLINLRHNAKNTCLGCGSLFVIVFVLTGGAVFIPFEHTFDFDDETIFFSTKYRIVVTSQVIRSGGQSYIAVLERNILSESCVFKPQYCRRWDRSEIIKTDKGPALKVNSENTGRFDTLYWNP